MIVFSFIACPPCWFDDHEVCVLPKNGSPHCECADGYVRGGQHECVPCVQGMRTWTKFTGFNMVIFFDFVKLIFSSSEL